MSERSQNAYWQEKAAQLFGEDITFVSRDAFCHEVARRIIAEQVQKGLADPEIVGLTPEAVAERYARDIIREDTRNGGHEGIDHLINDFKVTIEG